MINLRVKRKYDARSLFRVSLHLFGPYQVEEGSIVRRKRTINSCHTRGFTIIIY